MKSAVTDYGEDPRLCRKNDSSVEDLGIRSFAFDIIGTISMRTPAIPT